jgi:F-type H+-transporting ATPase subunit epsilon
MANTPFTVAGLTPEGEAFNGEVQRVSTRTTLGEIGILANHEPLLATLDETETRLFVSDTETLAFKTGEGYLQVAKNHVLILVKDAESVTPSEPGR